MTPQFKVEFPKVRSSAPEGFVWRQFVNDGRGWRGIAESVEVFRSPEAARRAFDAYRAELQSNPDHPPILVENGTP